MKGFVGFFINVLMLLGLLTLFGCKTTATGEMEFGFKQETEFALYHRVVADDKTASTSIEFPALIEWVLGSNEENNTSTEPDG